MTIAGPRAAWPAGSGDLAGNDEAGRPVEAMMADAARACRRR